MIDKNIKVSVIIPVYNVEKYLCQCLESVVNQTLEDIEIICVNDASCDNSLKILEQYQQKDSRIKIINLKKNAGVANARNCGIEIATGEYIMFLDSDDWLEIYACETAYNQIKTNHNDFAIFNYNEYFEDSGEYRLNNKWRTVPFNKVKNNPNINLLDMDNDFIKNSFVWAEIFSKEFLLKNDIKYDEAIKLCEDAPFMIKAFVCANNISIIDKSLYNYRVRNTSASFKVATCWKDLLLSRKICFNIIKQSQNEKHFIYPYMIFTISTMFFWLDRIENMAPENAKEFYTGLRDLFIIFDTEYDVEKISSYINYKRFKKMVRRDWNSHNLHNILRKLFVVYNDGSQKIFRFLGIKIKIKRERLKLFSITPNYCESEYSIKLPFMSFKKRNRIYKKMYKEFKYYKKHDIDIRTYPQATGKLRNLQMANFYLLNILDKICKDNNIEYWLDFGTLIGAVRHKGCIPWDDDIDVSMMRNNYNKIYDLVNNNTYDPNVYAEFYRHNVPHMTGKWIIMKILHKKFADLFVDIFPYDYLGKQLNVEEQYEFSQIVKNTKQIIQRKYRPNMTTFELKKDNDKWCNFLYGAKEVPDENSDLIWGMDYEHAWRNWIYSHSTIFPLQDIEFEGKTFKCPHRKEEYLMKVYGNFMSYPNNIIGGHSLYKKLPEDEYQGICELAKKVQEQ